MMSFGRLTRIILAIIGCAGLSMSGVLAADLAVTFEKTVHFTAPNGEDAVVEPGTYEIEVADQGLRLLAPGGKEAKTTLVHAEILQTEVLINQSQVDSQQVGEDHHQLLVQLSNGTLLAADGYYSGAKARATISGAAPGTRYLRLVPKWRRAAAGSVSKPAPTTPIPTPTLPQQGTLWDPAKYQQDLMTSHNTVRAGAIPTPPTPLPSLRWNQQVADVAAGWAKQCKMEHNPQKGMLGENLFAAWGVLANLPTAAVTAWAAEAKNYNYETNLCTASSGAYCGHYTQVVWGKSTDVGCAIATCPSISNMGNSGGALVVCNYSPPGNFNGERPY